MDNKTVALVGALLVLGVAVYGMATGNLPGFEGIGEEEEVNGDGGVADMEETNGEDNGAEAENGEEDGEDEELDEEIEEIAAETGLGMDEILELEPERREELLRRARLPQVCEDQGEEVELDSSHVPIRAGPPFNPKLFESMVHNELNDLRIVHSDGEPLDCDPELRDIAREHSELVIEGDEINATDVRYEGICENPRENYGTWYYQRDMELDSPDVGSDQRVNMIRDHEEFVRDVRRVWYNSGNVMGAITDESRERQGIGAHIERDTRRVVVTHVVC